MLSHFDDIRLLVTIEDREGFIVDVEFSKARKMMVDTQLLTNGVINHDILASMGSVPRESFLAKERQPLAYSDMDHQLSSKGQFLLAPVSFGRLLQLAEIKPTDVVLVVGCSIAYSLAVIANLASTVVGVEQDEDIISKANRILTDLDVSNAAIIEGDPTKGIAFEAPYDVIIIEGMVDIVPKELLDQLRDGSRLVAVINEGATGVACVYVKSGDNIAVRKMFNLNIPMLSSFQKKPEFTL